MCSLSTPQPPPEFMPDSPYSKQPAGAEGYWSERDLAIARAEGKAPYLPVVCKHTWGDLGVFMDNVHLVQDFVRKVSTEAEAVIDAKRAEARVDGNAEGEAAAEKNHMQAGIKFTQFRGLSPSRLVADTHVGSAEFADRLRFAESEEAVKWPAGYPEHYIFGGNVMPTRRFFEYIMARSAYIQSKGGVDEAAIAIWEDSDMSDMHRWVCSRRKQLAAGESRREEQRLHEEMLRAQALSRFHRADAGGGGDVGHKGEAGDGSDGQPSDVSGRAASQDLSGCDNFGGQDVGHQGEARGGRDNQPLVLSGRAASQDLSGYGDGF
eukprot:CAMPEP_0198498206 /NCGR_PEP_ID=MMETSP1462-20131121/6864_1 /TAXON_ID=1333877 /ORGANISM="Brandtodinium nutriculum, Strain RCC3387" /LENGTH=320 /DNA_ID=CAMNT_0044227109 /DNA_START=41 /DNA_END=1003 /DNA_ORIENTATION=+